MKKSDLIKQTAQKVGLTKPVVESVVNAFLESIKENVKEGHEIEIRGFGSFYFQKRKARKYRNVHGRFPIDVPTRYLPKFKFHKVFVDEAKKTTAQWKQINNKSDIDDKEN